MERHAHAHDPGLWGGMSVACVVVAALLLQQTAEPPPFPQTGAGVLSWMVRNWFPLAVAVGFIWRVAIRPMKQRDEQIDDKIGLEKGQTVKGVIDGWGKRVGDVEKSCADAAPRIERVERSQEMWARDVGRMAENVGELRALTNELINRITTNAAEIKEAVHEEGMQSRARDAIMGERLAKVEGALDIAESLDRNFARIADIMQQRKGNRDARAD